MGSLSTSIEELTEPEGLGALKPAWERARSLAKRRGRPVLLRVPLPCAVRDPWQLLSSISHHRTAWFDGVTGLCVAATGRARTMIESGPNRFAALTTRCSELRDEVIDVGDHADMPLAFLGFTFDEVVPSAGFEGWPSAVAWVPDLLVCNRGVGPSFLLVSVDVNAESSYPEATARIKELAQLAARATDAAEPATKPNVGLVVTPIESRSDWNARVRAATQAIRAGQLEKVVLARECALAAPAGQVFDPVGTAHALRRQHPEAFCFLVEASRAGSFVGASPETLVRVEGRRMTTHALAGTAPRGGDAVEDDALGAALLASTKDRHEQSIVTDALIEALSPVCEPLRVGEEPLLVRLPQLQHLATTVTGHLRDGATVLELAARLHPTPAVGGRPALAARDWLRREERFERGWYAAPLGWLGVDGSGVLSVAIRSALLRGGEARAFLGAGIVADSQPDAEWDETRLKLQTIEAALTTRIAETTRVAETTLLPQTSPTGDQP